MILRPILRQSTLLLALAVGLQSPAPAAARFENVDPQERREGRPEHQEARQDRREARPERQEAHQERREARPAPRDERLERRGDNRGPQEQRRESRLPGRPQPYAQPRGNSQNHGNLNASPFRSRGQAQTWERNRGWRNEGAWGAHSTWREHRARTWESEHRSWAHRGGYGGYIIPDSQFRLHYGPERWFRIRTRPMIHLGYPRFRYGNYWFLMVDPWPEFWSDSWYANDDVYIDYNDGYYLHNRRHPGIALAISVSL